MKSKELMINKIDLLQRVDFTSAKKSQSNRSNKQLSNKFSTEVPTTIMKKRVKSSVPKLTFHTLYQDLQDYRYCSTQRAFKEVQNPEVLLLKGSYGTNYKCFPQRSRLSSPYIIQDSKIVINIFTKKIEREELRNQMLAKKMSLQLKSNQQTRKMETAAEKRSKSKDFRLKSAKIIPSPCQMSPRIKNQFTPWDAQMQSATLIH